MGLAVVWNAVQDHNGYIDVKSSEKGTVFELYFPVTREEVAAEEEEVPMEDYLGNGEKILVVDDEENQREIASGYAKTKEVDMAQELGAGKYIKKPYTLEKVGVAVKEELEK